MAPYYNTKFSTQPFPESLVQKMTSPNCPIKEKRLGLPPPNNLIPKCFDIKAEDKLSAQEPILLKKDETGEFWFKKDDKFRRPKAIISGNVFTSDCGFGVSTRGRMFATVWDYLLAEYNREFVYNAECAGLKFYTDVKIDSVLFHWQGYDDSMLNYVQETLKRINTLRAADTEAYFN